MESENLIDGATVIARAVKKLGLQKVFGIIGFPVIELGLYF